MIYFVSYASEFCSEKRIILKNGKEGFFSRMRHCDNDSNSGYVRKWKTGHCLENGQGFSYKKNSFYNFDLRKKFKTRNYCPCDA